MPCTHSCSIFQWPQTESVMKSNNEKILRQLESQKEDIDNQDICSADIV